MSVVQSKSNICCVAVVSAKKCEEERKRKSSRHLAGICTLLGGRARGISMLECARMCAK